MLVEGRGGASGLAPETGDEEEGPKTIQALERKPSLRRVEVYFTTFACISADPTWSAWAGGGGGGNALSIRFKKTNLPHINEFNVRAKALVRCEKY
jgi:hypothetical protein